MGTSTIQCEKSCVNILMQADCIKTLNSVEPSYSKSQISSTRKRKSHDPKVLSFGDSSYHPLLHVKRSKNIGSSIGIQVQRKLVQTHFQSKYTMCVPQTSDVFCQSEMPKVPTVDKMCSPIKLLLKSTAYESSSTCTSVLTSKIITSSEYVNFAPESEYKSSNCSEEKRKNKARQKQAALNRTKYFISTSPKNILESAASNCYQSSTYNISVQSAVQMI